MNKLDLNIRSFDKINSKQMSNIVGGASFLDGAKDAWDGAPAQRGAPGFWYYVGYYGQVMAGGFDHGSDLKHGQIGG